MHKRSHRIWILMILMSAFTAACGPQEGDTGLQRSGLTEEASDNLPLLVVYKNPTCGCCTEWVKHVEENGFKVEIHDMGLEIMKIKNEHQVPTEAASCHTTLAGGYVFEGHVPADLLVQVLRERPDIKGLAVPGMPSGVPGMGADGPGHEPYEVFALNRDGTISHFATK